ncbi:HalOD1 output domain-containing protein [Halobacterium yunchengense]|uniref:HalOD1 output domain-containing protein n=1 Tax=Halobacterium yunchengense TaxID=3108497 RepID=UPI00300A69EB
MNSDTNDISSAAISSDVPAVHRDNWTDYDHPSTAIAELVAVATGREQVELSPLQRTVDADALNALLTGAGSDHLELTFEYESVTVRATSRGVVEVWQ